jgi:acyl-CoA synthetase (AMP-forming)/AMP-acid ligase II
MKVSIGNILADRARLSPNAEAVVDPNHRYDFATLNNRVNQLAKWLKERNIGKGDRIAICSRNNTEWITTFFAAAKLGAMLVPLNTRLHVEELLYVVKSCSPKVLIYESDFIDYAHKLRMVPSVEVCVQIGDSSRSNDPLFDSIFTDEITPNPPVVASGDDPFLLVFTSGTTGRPKGVVITHNNLYSNTAAVLVTLDFREDERYLAVTPLFHISGLVLTTLCAYRGGAIITMPEFHPVKIWDVIEQEKITSFMSVPPMLIVMLQAPDWRNKKLASLRNVFCGGTFVPPDLLRLYNSLGIGTSTVYGCTEASGALSFFYHKMGIDKCHTVGKPLPFCELKILDPISGQEVAPGNVGEVVARAPYITPGYWQNEEETKKVLRDGWLYTGDLGKLDEDGFLVLVDRLKDLIVCNGENVYPAEVEAILQNIEGVAEVAVIGITHPTFGEVPRAYVVPKPGYNLSEADILEHCYDRLAAFKCGKDVRFVKSLPRNAFGKVVKDVLRKQAMEEEKQKG